MNSPVRALAALFAAAATAALLTATAPATAAPSTATGAPATAAPTAARLSGDPHWVVTPTGSDQQFRGLDAVNRNVAWVGGSDGQVLRTIDGGKSWQDISPDDTAGLLFRDVEAFSRRHASVMAIGEGDASRIYTTLNGGRTWTLAFVNDDPAAFYDCMAFWRGGRRGIGMSDPVHGKFRIIRTDDGGRSWRVLPNAGMPPAVDGEFGFAASGTCVETAGWQDAWLASGGAAARVFHSRDGGYTWTVADSTIPATDFGGVFSLDFRNPRGGIAVGGDFIAPDNGVDASAYTRDGGSTWTNGGDLSGYRSGVAWLRKTDATAIAVGPTGSDITHDGGMSWTAFDDTNLDAVVCPEPRFCWASGPDGVVAVLAW